MGTADGDPVPERAVHSVDTVAVEAGDVSGQTVYVPVYSHVFIRDSTRWLDLAVTLSVRNTDPDDALAITSVRYYDDDGQLVREHLHSPVALGPYASKSYVVDEADRTGGVGANFVVEWQADARVSPPIVEAVMVRTAGAQGISFVSRGEVTRMLRDGVWESITSSDLTGL